MSKDLEEVVDLAERNIEYVISNPDMYEVSTQVKQIVRQALTTYSNKVANARVAEERERMINLIQMRKNALLADPLVPKGVIDQCDFFLGYLAPTDNKNKEI